MKLHQNVEVSVINIRKEIQTPSKTLVLVIIIGSELKNAVNERGAEVSKQTSNFP